MRKTYRALVAFSLAMLTSFTPGVAVAASPTHSPTPAYINLETGGYLAAYNGKTIDLSQGWQGATICVEQDNNSFTCYDNEADYQASEGINATSDGVQPLDSSDCPSGYFCLWEKEIFTGKRVQFRNAGGHSLVGTGLWHQGSSYWNRRLAAAYLLRAAPSCDLFIDDSASESAFEGQLRQIYDPCLGRSWNDQADSVYLCPLTDRLCPVP
jgi:hypothetical protein